MTDTRSKEVVKRARPAVPSRADELTSQELVAQVKKIQAVMKAVMKEGTHYGVIPGTDKPTLLKPGAEKLMLTFRLAPEYEILTSSEEDTFIAYTVRCTLTHINTGATIAEGVGSCNSKENKYRWRSKKRTEKPSKEEADRLKDEGKGYWRKDWNGQWAWFDKTENDNPWELQNTLLKMASKRALVAAVLNATAASDIFAQDLEDLAEVLNLEDAEEVATLNPELLGELRTTIREAALHREDLWGEDVVVANARRTFKRQIGKLEDLNEDEVTRIIEGARNWIATNVGAEQLEPLPEEVSEQ
jgi:hypothetical protein